MSNTERKARKRTNIPFHREPKIGTPLEDRAKPGTGEADPTEYSSPAERARALADAARARRAARDTAPPAAHTPPRSTASRKAG